MSGRPERYRHSDVSEVAQLWYRSWRSSGPPDADETTPKLLEQRLEDEPWTAWVVRNDERIVAFLAVDHEEGTLAQLFVDPSCQGAGIGQQLLRLAKRELFGGFLLRTHEGNSGARRFYERHGLTLDRVEDGRAHYAWMPGSGEVG